MGDILLHAVIVFCDDQTYGEPSKATDSLKDFLASYAPENAAEYDPREAVAIVGPLINAKSTVILAPSGSKLGWGPEKEWRTFREKFIEWAKTRRYAHILRVTDIYEPDGNQERWRVEEDRGAVGVGVER